MSARESVVPRSEAVEHVFVDGDWRPKEEARVSVFDHGLLYGDGVYEGLRAYGGRVFMAEAHLQRLARSARCLGIDLPKTTSEITALIEQGMTRNTT
jgi:branched-chain amino acid aminotransferase